MNKFLFLLCVILAGCYGGNPPRLIVTAPAPFMAPAPAALPKPKLPAFRFDPDLRPEDRTLFTPDEKPIYPMIVTRWP